MIAQSFYNCELRMFHFRLYSYPFAPELPQFLNEHCVFDGRSNEYDVVVNSVIRKLPCFSNAVAEYLVLGMKVMVPGKSRIAWIPKRNNRNGHRTRERVTQVYI